MIQVCYDNCTSTAALCFQRRDSSEQRDTIRTARDRDDHVRVAPFRRLPSGCEPIFELCCHFLGPIAPVFGDRGSWLFSSHGSAFILAI
jgi:hypothetical protein